MITAKNIFTLEQEMISELVDLTYQAGLSSEEREHILSCEIDEFGYSYLLKTLSDRILSPLVRVRNGETVLMSDINKAVKQASNNE